MRGDIEGRAHTRRYGVVEVGGRLILKTPTLHAPLTQIVVPAGEDVVADPRQVYVHGQPLRAL
jgi:hypothetical protein